MLCRQPSTRASVGWRRSHGITGAATTSCGTSRRHAHSSSLLTDVPTPVPTLRAVAARPVEAVDRRDVGVGEIVDMDVVGRRCRRRWDSRRRTRGGVAEQERLHRHRQVERIRQSSPSRASKLAGGIDTADSHCASRGPRRTSGHALRSPWSRRRPIRADRLRFVDRDQSGVPYRARRREDDLADPSTPPRQRCTVPSTLLRKY